MENNDKAVDAALEKVRKLCAKLPHTSEVRAWGHPNFKVAKKTFAAFEKYKGEWVIAFKAEPEHQRFLVETDDRFYVSPYVGKQGWVSMRVEGRVNWRDVKRFLEESYQLVTEPAPGVATRSRRTR